MALHVAFVFLWFQCNLQHFSATSSIAMLLSCLLMYSPVAQELSCIIDSKIQVLHSSCTSLTVKSELTRKLEQSDISALLQQARRSIASL